MFMCIPVMASETLVSVAIQKKLSFSLDCRALRARNDKEEKTFV
jgi:hypothetical protein